MDKSVKFWNSMSNSYDNQVNKKYSEAYKKTIEKTKKHLKEKDKVLDFACGTGITTVELADSVENIFAIDISDKMIEVAKNKITDNSIENVNFTVCDIMDNTLKDDSFDVILAFNILYFLRNDKEVVRRIHSLLKKGGLFISVTDCFGEKNTMMTVLQSCLSKIGIIPYMKKYKMKDIDSLLKESGFTIKESENLYTIPPNYYVVAEK